MAYVEVFDSRQRNAGTYTSQSVAVTPTTQISVRAIMAAADRGDAALTIRLAIEGSFEVNAQNWVPLLSVIWKGGAAEEGGGNVLPPSASFGPPPAGLQFVRGVADLNKRVSIGVEVEGL